MITKNDLVAFKNFCAKRHNIKIQDSVLDEFLFSIQTSEYENSSEDEIKEMECGYDNSVCAHVSFNTVKCDACSY